MAKALTLLKVLFALVVLVTMIAIVAHGIIPRASAAELVVAALAAIACVAIVMALALLCSLQFRQWVLRHGGIDAQWLWFKSDPPGLEELRRKDRRTGSADHSP